MSGEQLAAVNATLNAVSCALLISGWRAVKRGDTATHRRRMMAAFLSSGVFLVTYLWRWATMGTVHFSGTGALLVVYLLVLFTHVPLAISVVPMALMAIARGRRGDIAGHKRVTRWLFPIWTYVSITGVIVYLMLFHIPGLPPKIVSDPLVGR